MKAIYEVWRDRFVLSTDSSRLDIGTILDFLARSYWAQGRPPGRTQEALENSLVFGVYDGERQIGLARVVTDYAVVAYLCDVFIHEDYRGRGLGQWLVQSVLSHPDLMQVRRWLLATNDAHGLYRRFGFKELDQVETWMQRLRPFPGE